MDACLTETAPTMKVPMARRAVLGPHWLRWAFAAVMIAGVGWRAVRYCCQFPIWGDEAMLLLNILERDYLGLTEHLRFAQVAPIVFLWLEKSALIVLGPSEWSVHLFPMLAGLAALAVFWQTCRAHFTATAAGLAVGILAVSYYPVRHACEVKPYAFDLLFAAIYFWMTLGYLRASGSRVRWLIALGVLTPIAVFTSYPSVFVAGSVSLVLLPTMRSASWTRRTLYVVFNIALVASFVLLHGVLAHKPVDAEEAQRSREFLLTYWKDAFPPEDVLQWPFWLVKIHTGNMLAYPIGANRGGSSATFLLILLGSLSLWRSGQRSLLALCWLPFGLNLVAAMLHKYPFGDSARITLHLAPSICVLMAHGLAQSLDWIRDPHWRIRLHLSIYVLLLGLGITGIVRDLAKPYKTEHDRDVRRLARDIAARVETDEPVLLGHSRDEELIAEFLWYLRTEPLRLRWQSEGIEPATRSYWLVRCSNQQPAATAMPGWRIAENEVRFVQSENNVMAPMYCRWMRLVRD